MKVRMTITGETVSHDAHYALRLIEQGLAVPVKEAARTAKKKEPEPDTEPREPVKAQEKGKK